MKKTKKKRNKGQKAPPASQATPIHAATAEKPVAVILCGSLKQIMFDSWIKCACDNDYTPLIVSGTPSKEQLNRAWMDLLSQYYALTGSRSAAKYVTSTAKIEAHRAKIAQVELLIGALRLQYSDHLCQCLKNWGYKQPFTPETLAGDLDKVGRLLGNDRFKLEKALKDQEAESGNKHNPLATEESYMATFYAIEKHRKMVLNSDSTSVYKYCIMLKELEKYNDFITKNNK